MDISDLPVPDISDLPVPPKAPTSSPQSTFHDVLANLASAVVRPAAKAVAALPLMAMNAGVASRNLIGDATNKLLGRPATPDYTLPSSMFQQMLDHYTRAPSGVLGNGAEFVSSALLGSGLPMPATDAAPANFMPSKIFLRNQILSDSQKAGYVVPPTSANPTIANRLLEGVAGKLKTQQEAALRNQDVTDRLMAQSVGESGEAPLTKGSLDAIRKNAGSAYQGIQNAKGPFVPDSTFRHQLAGIKGAYEDVAKDFPGLAKPEITEKLDSLNVGSFSPKSALAAVSILRSDADTAYAGGNKSLGGALRKASSAMEDLIERNLTRLHAKGQLQAIIDRGALEGDDSAQQLLSAAIKNPSSKLLQNFKDARSLIAKTYTAGKALTESGNFDARKIANELARGKPLQGPQRTVARFAGTFPKASRLTQESFPAISPLDAYGSAIAGAAAHSAAPFAIPLTRVALREYLLSPAGQAKALQATYQAPKTIGLLPSSILQSGLLSRPSTAP